MEDSTILLVCRSGMAVIKCVTGELLVIEACILLAIVATDGVSRASACTDNLWLFGKAGKKKSEPS